jgi:hypothetical protein
MSNHDSSGQQQLKLLVVLLTVWSLMLQSVAKDNTHVCRGGMPATGVCLSSVCVADCLNFT